MRCIADSHRMTIRIVVVVSCMGALRAWGFAGGTGTPNDPFQIATVQHLLSIGSDPRLLDKCYRLTDDLDLAPGPADGRVFTQALVAPDVDSANGFQGRPFVGCLDGRGHTIRHLTIQGGTESCLGLFGALGAHAEVMDLSIVDANVVGGKDGAYVGALAGTSDGYITGCRVAGTVSGDYGVGAIVGRNGSHGTVIRCGATGTFRGNGRVRVVGGLVGVNEGAVAKSSTCSATVTSEGLSDSLGGLVGVNSGRIVSCLAKGEVTGGWCLGGLVAVNTGRISSSYAEVAVASRELSQRLGGLVGDNAGTVINCYANGTILNVFHEDSLFGGLIGSASESARTIGSFWDTEASGIRASEGGTGLATSQMMDVDVYRRNGWQSDPNWVIDSGGDYPRLAWENTPGQSIRQ